MMPIGDGAGVIAAALLCFTPCVLLGLELQSHRCKCVCLFFCAAKSTVCHSFRGMQHAVEVASLRCYVVGSEVAAGPACGAE
jgi:hypothetical protein